MSRFVARMDALDRPTEWSVWDDDRIMPCMTGLDKGQAHSVAENLNKFVAINLVLANALEVIAEGVTARKGDYVDGTPAMLINQERDLVLCPDGQWRTAGDIAQSALDESVNPS